MMSRIGFLISMFGTRMCGQTLLFIVIANCAILGIWLHCVLSLAAQCIVIGPVCVCVCLQQAGGRCLLPR